MFVLQTQHLNRVGIWHFTLVENVFLLYFYFFLFCHFSAQGTSRRVRRLIMAAGKNFMLAAGIGGATMAMPFTGPDHGQAFASWQ